MGCCYSCFRKLEKKFGSCSHIKTMNKRQLEASGYAFVIHDNYSREIVMSRSYFQTSEEGMTPVRHFMECLQEEVVPFLTDKISPQAKMIFSKTDDQSFKAATKCYCCHKRFRDMSGQDNKVRDHCHVLGMSNLLLYDITFWL